MSKITNDGLLYPYGNSGCQRVIFHSVWLAADTQGEISLATVSAEI